MSNSRQVDFASNLRQVGFASNRQRQVGFRAKPAAPNRPGPQT